MKKLKPINFLNNLKGKRVKLTLKLNYEIEGILITFDNFFNIILGDCKEIKNNEIIEVKEAFIRHNNIKIIQEN